MTLPVLLMLLHDASGVVSVDEQDPSAPQVSVLDLGVTRGDGIFESIGVIDGRAQALEPHLARLAKSAAMLDLPAPDLDVWRAAILRSIELAGSATVGSELLVKVILTRGIEDGDSATGWVYCFDAGHYDREREAGIAVVTLDRGYRSDVAETSPWLLQGAKTLSYAINKAALREAARRGADDVIFVSTDGFVLEGPNSTVIALIDGAYVTTPPSLGVLEGTTQGAFFADAQARGASVEYRAFTVDELRGADALWLASSGRQIAPVVTLDGQPVSADPAFTAGAVERLLAR
ncbi:4-amino-4-deoxychorismate lyase [Frondihabitans sucicola]|uniref:4-amino-4-deoxychorismate lyase n=1 Tax=Frondihabitans sucicola TaxID=1268041 RepID=A0ABM8GTL9_9MICO|nr:aminodeoxychorismate lyase [Frondihabitans sucicola]BDZ51812.1 4-amino-4-deoxychorismate lyase [Frondihabitans sucicola]